MWRAAAALGMLVTGSSAQAQPSRARPTAPERERTPDYGAHIFAADLGGTFTAIVLTAATERGELLLLPLLTGPTVHLVHGRGGRAIGSLALRAGLPAAGAWLGFELDEGEGGDFDGLGGLLLGGGVGLLGAMIIDWTVLGDGDAAETTRPATTTWVAPVSGGALAGVGGAW